MPTQRDTSDTRTFASVGALIAILCAPTPVAWSVPDTLPPHAGGQTTFEQTARDLASLDPGVRLRAVRLLKEAAYPEAAVPLAKLVTDPEDDVQLEAIAAELNIFLAEKIVPHKRVGFVVEVRNKIAADVAFSNGPGMLGTRPVPPEVLTALRAAVRDDN